MGAFNPITRRRLIAGSGLAATMAMLGSPAAQGQEDGFRVLRAREGNVRLRGPDREPTVLWGYEGVVPGPLLRVRRGELLKVRVSNETSTNTTIHWHGVRVPNAFDGVAPLTQRPVAPGTSFDYQFAPPDAGTYWYHPAHRADQGRALYGALIVDEAEPVDIDRDVLLVLDAWRLGPDGRLAPDAPAHFTANSLPSFDIAVAANDRVRLRLINAAEQRITLRIDDHPMHVAAIDGQPAEPFASRESRITLSPGNRADVFVDAVLKPGSVAPIVVQNDANDVPVARLVYDGAATARAAARTDVRPLPPNPLPERMDFRGSLRAELTLDASPRDRATLGASLFSAKRGRTVMLALANKSATPHVLHIHGHHARLLDALDDGWKPFWLDTILCVPQQTTRIAFVADNPGKWLLQSNAIGTDAQTLAWFEVA